MATLADEKRVIEYEDTVDMALMRKRYGDLYVDALIKNELEKSAPMAGTPKTTTTRKTPSKFLPSNPKTNIRQHESYSQRISRLKSKSTPMNPKRKARIKVMRQKIRAGNTHPKNYQGGRTSYPTNNPESA